MARKITLLELLTQMTPNEEQTIEKKQRTGGNVLVRWFVSEEDVPENLFRILQYVEGDIEKAVCCINLAADLL